MKYRIVSRKRHWVEAQSGDSKWGRISPYFQSLQIATYFLAFLLSSNTSMYFEDWLKLNNDKLINEVRQEPFLG